MALAIGIGRCSLNHQQKPLSSSEWDWDVHLSFQVLDVTPHLDSKGPRSLVDASSNGCWRSRYTTRYTVCNYVMCDIYIYTCGCLSILSPLLFSYPIYSYLSLSMYIHMQPQHHHQQLQLSTIVPLENPSPS